MAKPDRPVAWVAGGPRGLGVQVAKGLARDGYRIVINYRKSAEAARKLAAEIEQIGEEAYLIQGDLSRLEEIRDMARRVLNHWGRVDVLVLMAGPFIFNHTPVAAFTDAMWREMIEGNLSGAFYLFREIIPYMRKQGGGRLITLGYPDAEIAPAWAGFGPYAAAKTGLVTLTRTVALEEAENGITANMVYPGDIRDPYKEAMIAEARGKKDPRTPIGRPGTGEDVARVVRFLAHPDSDFITGAVIPVTGGFTNPRFYVK
ncbi:SDR family oxidoreductase [Thermoactinomyces daqus]|uniref:SDR family oxidoreductase n=1 Tax=Thermoactinomyces daqus TaxID=1329516 RepID=A0A7W2AIJ0_9BACL|nr:SDR family oxidoreductase [Thermoactinomyces daqus]MBA4542804.1 SDR family oxidoreductase [Thermoactinomyces daqus]